MGNALRTCALVVEDDPYVAPRFSVGKETEMTTSSPRDRSHSASTEASTVVSARISSVRRTDSPPPCFLWKLRPRDNDNVLIIPEEDEHDLDDGDVVDEPYGRGVDRLEMSGDGPLDSILTLSASSSTSASADDGVLEGESVVLDMPDENEETELMISPAGSLEDQEQPLRSRADSSAAPATPTARGRSRTHSVASPSGARVISVYQTDRTTLESPDNMCSSCQLPRLPFRTCQDIKCMCQHESREAFFPTEAAKSASPLAPPAPYIPLPTLELEGLSIPIPSPEVKEIKTASSSRTLKARSVSPSPRRNAHIKTRSSSSDRSLECTYSSSSGELSTRSRRQSCGPPAIKPRARSGSFSRTAPLNTIAPLPKQPKKRSMSSKQRTRSEDYVDLPSPLRPSPKLIADAASAPKLPPSLSMPLTSSKASDAVKLASVKNTPPVLLPPIRHETRDGSPQKSRAHPPCSPTSVAEHPTKPEKSTSARKTAPAFDTTEKQSTKIRHIKFPHLDRSVAFRRAQQLERHGQLDLALKAYRECIEQQRSKQMSPSANKMALSSFCHHLGLVHWKMGSYRPSLRVLEHAMEQAQMAHGCLTLEEAILVAATPAKHFLADLLISTSRVHLSLGQWREAKAGLHQALGMLQDTQSTTTHESSLMYAKGLVYLGMVYEVEGDCQRAIQQYQSALNRQQYSLGHTHQDVALTLSCLGNAFIEIGWLGPALSHLTEAVRIYRQLSCLVDVGNALVNIGWIHGLFGNAQAALAAITDGFHMLRQQLGDKHRNVCTAQFQIGLIYSRIGDVKGALKVYKRVWEQARESLGDYHTDVAAALDAISFAYESQNKVEKASTFVGQALNIRKRSLGRKHVQVGFTQSRMGQLHMRLGDLDRGRHAWTSALKIFQRHGLPSHAAHAEVMVSQLDHVLGSTTTSLPVPATPAAVH